MMQPIQFYLMLLSLFIGGQCAIPMCNDQDDPSRFPFDALTDADLQRIDELVQLNIVGRHGSRTGNIPIPEIFPKVNLTKPGYDWVCNFTTVTSRTYDNQEFMSFQKNYIWGEQYIGRDCLNQQSTYQAIVQSKLNAQLIKSFYIGDNKSQLFTEEEMDRMLYELFIQRKYKDNNIPYIKIISSDLERTYATASIFFKYFLQYSTDAPQQLQSWSYDGNKDFLYSYTHDPLSDPYIPQKVMGCFNLKKYINDRGRASANAQAYLQSDYVKDFFAQWKEEVGTVFDYSYHKFKYCENIMWMYCAGLDIVPNVISQSLFDKIHNYTIEYRRKSLNNEISDQTVTLASMPFAWILKTLMSDRIHYLEGNEQYINGYIDAKKAKLIFHSTRGISTLYFLRALGISDGYEPVYGNMVNFEVYSRSAIDYDDGEAIDIYGFNKYLFRLTNMGQLLPFPGCEDDYRNGESTLCNLNIFLNALTNLSMEFTEWEPYCANITDSYFALPKKKRNAMNQILATAQSVHQSGGTITFIIGIVLGAGVMCLFDRRRYLKSVYKDKYDNV